MRNNAIMVYCSLNCSRCIVAIKSNEGNTRKLYVGKISGGKRFDAVDLGRRTTGALFG